MTPDAPLLRFYDLRQVDQLQVPEKPDILPADPDARRRWARCIATEATILGLPAVWEFVQLHQQALDPGHERFVGFNTFIHERELATPAFTDFRTPNVDTLYSNAWLDLSGGPVVLDIPPIPDRYYTFQFVDAHGNATNLSSRTVGGAGGRFAVCTAEHAASVPAGCTPFRVATPHLWILLRILVRDAGEDAALVRSLQDAITVTPTVDPVIPPLPDLDSAAAAETEPLAFFAALDFMLRHNGAPLQEEALVRRFALLGVGGPAPFAADALDPEVRAGLEEGHAEAMAIIGASRAQVGERTATGWRTGTAGELGWNHLHRAVQNFVGTGGNVAAEKKFFVTFDAEDGTPLDGTRDHHLRFDVPPPVAGAWSLTVYPTRTGLLYENELRRCALSSTTPELRTNPDGSVDVALTHRRPPEDAGNWLPVPAEPYYVDLRMWEPAPEARDGRWLPGPIRPR